MLATKTKKTTTVPRELQLRPGGERDGQSQLRWALHSEARGDQGREREKLIGVSCGCDEK